MYKTSPNSSSEPSNHLYEKVLRDYFKKLNPIPIYPMNPTSNKLAIIIEPRYDDITIAVIHNFMYYMSPSSDGDKYSRGWNFMFMSYAGHEHEVRVRFPSMKFVAIPDKYIEMRDGKPNISINSYNSILLSKEFWEKTIPANYENICIFQRDCIMYKPIPIVFEKYDYAGATFSDVINNDVFLKPTPFYRQGINGGFSLRKRAAMLISINTLTIDAIKEYRNALRDLFKNIYETKYKLSEKKLVDFNFNIDNEDVFFSNACEIFGFLSPDILHSTQLALEMPINLATDMPSVYHGWDKSFHSYTVAVDYLSKSSLFGEFIGMSKTVDKTILIKEASKTEPAFFLPKNLCD